MLQSSLGFHTITLYLSLTYGEAQRLWLDFIAYSKNTALKMYRYKDGKYIRHYPAEHYFPPDIYIYFDGKYRGIKWHIYSNDQVLGMMYTVAATINPKVLAGIRDYLTAATFGDMNFAIPNFNFESQKISPLLRTFFDYKITRIDYCVNISLDEIISEYDSEKIMNLIKRSDIPPHYKEWMIYDNKAHRMKSRPESFYLKSNSVNINYYSKYMQLLNISQEKVENGFNPIEQEILDASQNIYRFEVQYKYYKIYSLSQEAAKAGDLSYNKYKSLLNPVKCIEIVSDYYKKTIGKGDWYALSDAMQIVKSKNFNSQKEQRLITALKYISDCRSLSKAKSSYPQKQLRAFKQTLDELSNLNINPVTIPREWNIRHIPNLLKTYFNKLLEDQSSLDIEKDIITTAGYHQYFEKIGHLPI